MREFDHRSLDRHPARIDRDAALVARVEWWKAIARRAEIIFSYAAIILGIGMFIMMAARTAPIVARNFTASPAPRPLPPHAAATTHLRAVEAGSQVTGEGR